MSRTLKALFVIATAMLLGACSTTGTFKIPEGTKLYVYDRPVEVEANGTVTTTPFKWNAIGIPPRGGVPYRLEKDGQVVQQGKLRSVFRGASLFWPPIAGVFVFPVGLNPNITYDLINNTQQ